MTATSVLIDLVVRLGAELDFDVAKHVRGFRGELLDVVWFNRRLPLGAVGTDPPDLRYAPVVPMVAFDIVLASDCSDDELPAIAGRLEESGAPLRVIVIGGAGKRATLSPVLKSVDAMQVEESEAALQSRIADLLIARPGTAGRTIVMLQQELIDWGRRLRDVKPRSYSAESMYRRTGVID